MAIILMAMASCKDPDSVIGLNVQPPSDKLGLSIDTVTLRTITVLDTGLRSDHVLNLLGSDYSSVFGKTQASIYTQVVFGGSTPNFGTSNDTLIPDSLVLRLLYNGFYGDTTTELTAKVYRLTADMNVDSPYYSNTVLAHEATPIGTLTFTPKPTTPVTEYGATVGPQLRIPLDTSLAREILAKKGLPELNDNASWTNYFKGLYIVVDPVTTPGKGAICYFNMSNTDSKLSLYFHRGVTVDSLHYDFQFTGARANHQEHDYTGSTVGAALDDSTLDVNYIQGAAGTKIKITMPFLNSLAGTSGLAINRAELIISKVDISGDTLSPPASLWVQAIDSLGQPAYIIDQFESSAFYGGTYNSTTKQYSFNLTHYFQQVITGKIKDHGLMLGVSGADLLEYFGVIQANHVKVGSGNASADPATKLKLKLYYTKLD